MSYIPADVLSKEAHKLYEEIYTIKDTLKTKDRIKIPVMKMPSQDPDIRSHNLDEVAIGYTAEEAIIEANFIFGFRIPVNPKIEIISRSCRLWN